MIRRIALSAGLIVLSALACAPKASAQSVNVDATATVSSSCSFGTPTAGSLRLDYTPQGGYLSNAVAGGTPATVTINCNGPMNLKISPVTLVNPPAAYTGTLTSCMVIVRPTQGAFGDPTYSNNSCSTSVTTSGNFITAAGGTTGTLEVAAQSALVPANTLLPAGEYKLRTTLTAVP